MSNTPKKIILNKPESWLDTIKSEPFQLFLDYDGTIAPFNSDPDKAYPAPGALEAIKKLSDKGREITIVTGRHPRDVRDEFLPGYLPIAGLHGRLYLPARQSKLRKLGPEVNPPPENAVALLYEISNENNNCWLEQKDGAFALHIPDSSADFIDDLYNDLVKLTNHSDWEIISGRKVLELRFGAWNKAAAVKELRNPDRLSIYIGDDRTDEDVFQEISPPALTIYVKNEGSINTKASYYLQDTAEVVIFLHYLGKIHP
ncbi:MAG: trehalose-phosphatase [Bacillota bacterium]